MNADQSADLAMLRRWVCRFVIAVAFAMACGRIASVQRIYEPAFHRDPAREGNLERPDRRPVWPSTRPDAMPMFGSNDRARWATIRALVHDRTYVVGQRDTTDSWVALLMATDPVQAAVLVQAGGDFRTDVSNPRSHRGILFKPGFKEHGWATIDRVMNPDTLAFYSSKPPLLATVLAGVYWVLFHVFGLSLIDNANTVVRLMLVLVNALPFAGYLWLLTRFAERWGKTDWGKLYLVVAGAFATTVTPFLITLNNHTLATFSVMAAWWSVLSVWDAVRDRQTPDLRHFVAAGFFASFAATCEMPALSFLAAALVLLVWWDPRRTLAAFVPLALVPMVGFFGTNYLAMGQLRPAQTEFGSAWYEYEGSHWKPPPPGQKKFGIDWAKHHETRADYALHVLVGHHGLFTLTPIWILSVLAMFVASVHVGGIWRQAFFRESGEFPWFVQPLGLVLTCVVIGFYLIKSDNYGGFTNGLRWLMWLTPIWLTCLMPAADWLATRPWGRWVGGVLLMVSIFSASYQLWNPWRHPWIFDLMLELGWSGY